MNYLCIQKGKTRQIRTDITDLLARNFTDLNLNLKVKVHMKAAACEGSGFYLYVILIRIPEGRARVSAGEEGSRSQSGQG